MCVVPVKVKCSNSKKEFRTHAMLDCCSQGTFISTDLARKLKAEGVQTTIKIKTLNGEESQETEAVSGLKVSKSSGESMRIEWSVAYAKDNLQASAYEKQGCASILHLVTKFRGYGM